MLMAELRKKLPNMVDINIENSDLKMNRLQDGFMKEFIKWLMKLNNKNMEIECKEEKD